MSQMIEAKREVVLPLPRVAINIRPGTMEDLAFIDGLQKKHTKMVGFMPTKALEGKIKLGHVLVAETSRCGTPRHPSPSTSRSPRTTSGGEGERVGYCIGNDQYFKRDDIGIIYQMNVVPGRQRGFVGATLLKAMFERSAWGCKLFCCWCAQDIEANRFWESMGFVPLAFRTGSAKRGSKGGARVHIFWEKRIREGDTGQGGTPWWFPSQTGGGSIREDRLVLPIPPGTHWSDAKPIILPGEESTKSEASNRKQIEDRTSKRQNKKPPVKRETTILAGGLKFEIAKEASPAKAKPKRANAGGDFGELSRAAPTPRKNDPKLIAAARELRDRWMEKVNQEGYLLEGRGKYEVSKTLSSTLSGVEGSEVEGSGVEVPALSGVEGSNVEGRRLPTGETISPLAVVEQAALCLPMPVAA